MTGNSEFQPVDAHGWRGGLNNLLRLEFGKWWGSSLWWIQTLIWVVVINGILAPIVWSEDMPGEVEGVMLYAVFSGLFTSIAVVVIMQDAIVVQVFQLFARLEVDLPIRNSMDQMYLIMDVTHIRMCWQLVAKEKWEDDGPFMAYSVGK